MKANKRAVAYFKIAELSELQSQIGDKDSDIRSALMQGVMEQLNDFLYSVVAPSTANPDHEFTGVATLAATDISVAVERDASPSDGYKAIAKAINAHVYFQAKHTNLIKDNEMEQEMDMMRAFDESQAEDMD